ncbi:VTT domain-containing protein [Aurantiacibacter marinus]|uniref:VTT domain-containing protein n=1 Tax=Aurantiacibacter marinus TaxID=874156 RepID=A0A0H0XSM9_9SPHN|nr:VTT domain-containing protein [Aurantiacibacter marinus]KLI64952.1 hypothetical protein AAV99_05535 [Aurantiacibacter marinus]
MDSVIAQWLPLGLVEAVAAMPFGSVAVSALIALTTASIMAFSIPGALTPTAFLSGLLLGFGGILVVALGAVIGSHILFLASRRWFAAGMRRRFGTQLDEVGGHLERRGPIYVAGARLAGVPHVLIAAGCAATPITGRTFAFATLLGLLPAITLAVSAGSAF